MYLHLSVSLLLQTLSQTSSSFHHVNVKSSAHLIIAPLKTSTCQCDMQLLYVLVPKGSISGFRPQQRFSRLLN